MAEVATLEAPKLHDVTIITTKKMAQARVMPVPPEEFGIERNARDIKTCNYCFHEIVTKTEADLIAEGYDEDQIKALEDYTGYTDFETESRDTVNEHYGAGAGSTATRLVRITEHYIRMDYEGNGRPCLYQVTTGGNQGEILKLNGKDCIEPFDMIPFATATPVPITHRFWGRSIADLVMDIQRVKTALLRGMLDNLYLHNNPRVEVAEQNAGPNTLDDLLVSRAGGIVRTKTAGGIQWQVVPDITGSVYPALGYMDTTREMRTGVTRQGQGVDANALQNQSATAVNQVFSAAQARMKLVARIIAETGIKDLFSLLHGVIRKHGQEKQTVRLRNKWVPIDPRQWKTRNDMTINVGLGNGGKAEQFAQMMALANVQKEMLAGGKSNLVGDKQLYNTAEQLSRLMGHKNANLFFNDPDEKTPDGQLKYPPVQPPPDPAVLKIQADAQAKDKELQFKGQELQIKSQLDAQADERKAGIEQVQAQADMVTQDRKIQGEAALARDKFEFEKQLKLMDFELKKQAHAEEMAMRREQHQQALQSGAFKMVQGAEAHSQKLEQAEAKPKGDK